MNIKLYLQTTKLTIICWMAFSSFADTCAQEVTLKTLSKKVLGINLKNNIEISVLGYKPEDIKVKFIGNGKLTGEKGIYTVFFDSTAKIDDSCFLLVYKKTGSHVLKRYRFYVIMIPKPEASFCRLKLTTDSTNTLYMPFTELIKLDSFCFAKQYDKYSVIEDLMRIQDFEVTIFQQGEPIVKLTSGRNRITHVTKTAFKSLKKGDVVFFNIRGWHRVGKLTGSLNPIVIKII